MLFYIPLCNMILRDVADLFEGEGIAGLEVGDVQTAFLEGYAADAGIGKVGAQGDRNLVHTDLNSP